MNNEEKIAKKIVGKWGYEESYWWKPIEEALITARQEAIEDCMTITIDADSLYDARQKMKRLKSLKNK